MKVEHGWFRQTKGFAHPSTCRPSRLTRTHCLQSENGVAVGASGAGHCGAAGSKGFSLGSCRCPARNRSTPNTETGRLMLAVIVCRRAGRARRPLQGRRVPTYWRDSPTDGGWCQAVGNRPPPGDRTGQCVSRVGPAGEDGGVNNKQPTEHQHGSDLDV
jgi:hypothetical protein